MPVFTLSGWQLGVDLWNKIYYKYEKIVPRWIASELAESAALTSELDAKLQTLRAEVRRWT